MEENIIFVLFCSCCCEEQNLGNISWNKFIEHTIHLLLEFNKLEHSELLT